MIQIGFCVEGNLIHNINRCRIVHALSPGISWGQTCNSRAATNRIVAPIKGSFPIINGDRQLSASISCALLW